MVGREVTSQSIENFTAMGVAMQKSGSDVI